MADRGWDLEITRISMEYGTVSGRLAPFNWTFIADRPALKLSFRPGADGKQRVRCMRVRWMEAKEDSRPVASIRRAVKAELVRRYPWLAGVSASQAGT